MKEEFSIPQQYYDYKEVFNLIGSAMFPEWDRTEVDTTTIVDYENKNSLEEKELAEYLLKHYEIAIKKLEKTVRI